jgi:hypothetical protein
MAHGIIGVDVAAIRAFMVMKYRFVPAAAASALCLCATLAFARPPERQRPTPPPQPPPAQAQAPRHLSLEQAVKQVQHQTHGHILAADSVSRGHNKVYRIKVLTPKGAVKVMQLHSNPRPKPSAGPHDSGQGGH